MRSAEDFHPGRSELARFMCGRLERCEVRAVVRHLLTGCPQCLQVTRHFWRLGDRVPRAPKPPQDPAARHSPRTIVGLKG